MRKFIFAVFVSLILLAGCSTPSSDNNGNTLGQQNNDHSVAPTNQTETAQPSSTSNEQVYDTPQKAAETIIAALKDKDMATLKNFVHPDKGLLFSPYVHIDTASALVFSANQLPALDSPTIYDWGQFDGSGDPMKLTFKQYYDKFVYNHDFNNPETIGWNEIKGNGNAIPNLAETFPGSYIVDYYFSGFEEQYGGMDWASLILVLEEHNGSWYLSAIVHSQWTI